MFHALCLTLKYSNLHTVPLSVSSRAGHNAICCDGENGTISTGKTPGLPNGHVMPAHYDISRRGGIPNLEGNKEKNNTHQVVCVCSLFFLSAAQLCQWYADPGATVLVALPGW